MCPVCHKRWMVTIPERGALPVYCSRACSARAARQRASARSEDLAKAIDDAITALEERHVAAAMRALRLARSLLAGRREGEQDGDVTDR